MRPPELALGQAGFWLEAGDGDTSREHWRGSWVRLRLPSDERLVEDDAFVRFISLWVAGPLSVVSVITGLDLFGFSLGVSVARGGSGGWPVLSLRFI